MLRKKYGKIHITTNGNAVTPGDGGRGIFGTGVFKEETFHFYSLFPILNE